MNTNVFENITLPSIYLQFRDVQMFNRRVILDLQWRERNSNTWYCISDTPPSGSYPRTFKALFRIPMFITPYHIDDDWQAEVTVTLTREYMMDSNGDAGFGCNVRFSNAPFHHHATGRGNTSNICLGNIGRVGRQGKVALILPMIAMLLNRDESVCHKGAHLNEQAFEHWRFLGYATISTMGMFGPDGNLINAVTNRSIPFKRV